MTNTSVRPKNWIWNVNFYLVTYKFSRIYDSKQTIRQMHNTIQRQNPQNTEIPAWDLIPALAHIIIDTEQDIADGSYFN